MCSSTNASSERDEPTSVLKSNIGNQIASSVRFNINILLARPIYWTDVRGAESRTYVSEAFAEGRARAGNLHGEENEIAYAAYIIQHIEFRVSLTINFFTHLV